MLGTVLNILWGHLAKRTPEVTSDAMKIIHSADLWHHCAYKTSLLLSLSHYGFTLKLELPIWFTVPYADDSLLRKPFTRLTDSTLSFPTVIVCACPQIVSKNENSTVATQRHTYTTRKEKNGSVREDHHAKQHEPLSKQNKLRTLWETSSGKEIQKMPHKEMASASLFSILKFVQTFIGKVIASLCKWMCLLLQQNISQYLIMALPILHRIRRYLLVIRS